MSQSNKKHHPRIPLRLLTALVLSLAISSCEVDDPEKEEVPELITSVELRFVPDTGGEPVIAIATDPDGEGVRDMEIDEPIKLAPTNTYTLSIVLINGLADATQPEYDVTEEVREEADEHMFFFGWTGNLFASPSGVGNADVLLGCNYFMKSPWMPLARNPGQLQPGNRGILII